MRTVRRLGCALDHVQSTSKGDVLRCRENARKKDVRLTNIEAAKAIADVIRTSLGPRGMDKMVRRIDSSACHSMHAPQQRFVHTVRKSDENVFKATTRQGHSGNRCGPLLLLHSKRQLRGDGRGDGRGQVCQADGEVIITNDGATILNKMSVTQPAAKMLVELSKSQVRLQGRTPLTMLQCSELLPGAPLPAAAKRACRES